MTKTSNFFGRYLPAISSTFEGETSEKTWRNVERNDIAVVYHDGAFVAKHERVFEVERLNQRHSLYCRSVG